MAARLGNVYHIPGGLPKETHSLYYHAFWGPKTLSAISNFNKNVYLPKLIKIISNDVSYTHQGSSQEQILAVIPAPTKNNTMYNFSVLKPSIMEFNATGLNKLGFKLLDEKDEQLKLSLGSATYLKLKMHANLNSRFNHLTLHSDDVKCSSMYPGNNASSFSTLLAKRLVKSSEKWYMNLSRISLPTEVNNITRDICTLTITNPNDIAIAQYSKNLQLPNGSYTSERMFIININVVLSQHRIKIDYNNTTGKCSINNFSSSYIQLLFNPVMSIVLGLTNTTDIQPLNIQPNSIIKSMFVMNLNTARPRHARIVCKQLIPSIFGSTHTQMLRFITLKNNLDQDVSSYEFYNDTPVAVNSSEISVVDIEVLNENNDLPLEFTNSKISSTFNIEILQ